MNITNSHPGTIKADNYRIYKLCNVIVQGGGSAYIGEVDLSAIPDLVSSHSLSDRNNA